MYKNYLVGDSHKLNWEAVKEIRNIYNDYLKKNKVVDKNFILKNKRITTNKSNISSYS